MNISEACFSPSLSNGDLPRTQILKIVRKLQGLHVVLLKSKGLPMVGLVVLFKLICLASTVKAL